MINLKLALLTVPLLITGCTTTTNVMLPSGNQGLNVTCGTGWNHCYKRAQELCPTGYHVHDKRGTNDRRSMLIECKTN